MISAPVAPIAPAWLTVAMPSRIEPKTAMISVRGGAKTMKTRRTNLKSNLPSLGTGGAIDGRISALTRT